MFFHIALLVGCEEASGLNDLNFVPESCESQAIEATCANVECGTKLDNCGVSQACPDTCAPPFACGNGVDANSCGCTGGSNTPAAPEGCVAFPGATANTYYVCDALSFPKAREFCQSIGTDMVIIKSPEENRLVHEGLSTNSFIGLFDADGCAQGAVCDFLWVDGSVPTFTNWDPNEPNNTGGGEHCVELRRDNPNATWNDIPCANVVPFVCETTCP